MFRAIQRDSGNALKPLKPLEFVETSFKPLEPFLNSLNHIRIAPETPWDTLESPSRPPGTPCNSPKILETLLKPAKAPEITRNALERL